jgi:hypothetical protein
MIPLCRSKDACTGMLTAPHVHDSLEALNPRGSPRGDKACVCCTKPKTNSADRKSLQDFHQAVSDSPATHEEIANSMTLQVSQDPSR